MKPTFNETVALHCRAGFGGIWIKTDEQSEAIRSLKIIVNDRDWDMVTWAPDSEQSIDQFLHGLGLSPDNQKRVLVVLKNPEKYFEQFPEAAQLALHKVNEAKQCRANLVVIAATFSVPPMLERAFTIIEHDLPDHAELEMILSQLGVSVEDDAREAVVNAAAGLTRFEAEDAFSLSHVTHEKVLATAVWEVKARELKKSGALELYEGDANFERLCGLDGLKRFCSRSAGKANAKGVLLLGVPGAGKSEFAKSLGNEVGLPTITMDIGAMMGSLVGQTEERLRKSLKAVERMSPCILFVDEIEKALSGAGSSNDSGVSQRMLGTLLTWLNDRQSSVYFIGTCNDITQLSSVSAGAFTRAERFDGIFYIGLPGNEQKQAMWQLYRRTYDLPLQGDAAVQDDGWTGAEIKACCRLSDLLEQTLAESSRMVVPVSRTAAAQISALDDWAHNRALDANTGEIYRKPESGIRRAI